MQYTLPCRVLKLILPVSVRKKSLDISLDMVLVRTDTARGEHPLLSLCLTPT